MTRKLCMDKIIKLEENNESLFTQINQKFSKGYYME